MGGVVGCGVTDVASEGVGSSVTPPIAAKEKWNNRRYHYSVLVMLRSCIAEHQAGLKELHYQEK